MTGESSVLSVLFCILIFSVAHSISKPRYYSNPISPSNNPDPGAYYDPLHDRFYLAVTTDNNSIPDKFPIRSSAASDMVHWPIVAYVFPRTYQHPWAVKDFWAPEIHFVDGQFVVYYAARHKDGMLCVGAAIAKNVIGPYTDIGYPLIHNTSVGMIDPHYFKDPVSGLSYLFWKEDANGLHPPRNYTPIWVRQLTPDGLHFVGPQTLVLQNDPMSWEGGLVEAPWVIYLSQFGYYYLFYSANVYNTPLYAIGVARSRNVLGPYIKNPSNPIVHSNQHWSGPGHCSVLPTVPSTMRTITEQRAQWFLLYHSYTSSKCGPQYPRTLVMDALFFDDEDKWPFVMNNAPSYGKTPIPGTEGKKRK